MITSVVSAIQIPDPTSVGLFQQQPQPRQRVYRDYLQGDHRFVAVYGSKFVLMVLRSTFTVGDNSTSIFNFGLLLDPISDSAQRRVDLLEVSPNVCIDNSF